MTSLAVDWVALSTPEFVAWTRRCDVPIPFPLNTNGLPYGAAPSADELDRSLARRGLDGSRALAAAQAAFAEARLVVYAVRAKPDGTESKYVAVAGRRGRGALVLLDATDVGIREVSDNELAASLAGALPALRGYPTPTVEVPRAAMQHVDALIAAGESARTVRAEMARAGMPQALIAVQEQGRREAVTTGLLSAVGYDGAAPGDTGGGTASGRSALWRELPEGVLLQIERRNRGGQPSVLFTPYTTDALFRAAVDAVSGIEHGAVSTEEERNEP